MKTTPCTEASCLIIDFSFNLAPRCGATTRGLTSCKSPAVRGKVRCRMHGGASGTGARKGNQNALKDGLHSELEKNYISRVRDCIKDSHSTIDDYLDQI